MRTRVLSKLAHEWKGVLKVCVYFLLSISLFIHSCSCSLFSTFITIGGDGWFPATIEKIKKTKKKGLTFTLAYDDGDIEKNVTLSNLKFLEAKDELEVLENDQISKNLCQIRMCSDKGIFQCSKCKLVVCTEHELHGAHRPLPKTKLCAIIDISNTSIPSSIQKEKEESKSENKSVIELDKEEEEEEEEEKEEEEVEEVEGPFILNRSIIPFILNRSIIPITIVIGAKSSNKWDGN